MGQRDRDGNPRADLAWACLKKVIHNLTPPLVFHASLEFQ